MCCGRCLSALSLLCFFWSCILLLYWDRRLLCFPCYVLCCVVVPAVSCGSCSTTFLCSLTAGSV
jgi:hypothetical protein